MERKILESLTDLEFDLLRMLIYTYEGILRERVFKLNEETIKDVIKYYEKIVNEEPELSSFKHLLDLAFKLEKSIKKEILIDSIIKKTIKSENKSNISNLSEKKEWDKNICELCDIINDQWEQNLIDLKIKYRYEKRFVKEFFEKYLIVGKGKEYSFNRFYGNYKTNKTERAKRESILKVKKK